MIKSNCSDTPTESETAENTLSVTETLVPPRSKSPADSISSDCFVDAVEASPEEDSSSVSSPSADLPRAASPKPLAFTQLDSLRSPSADLWSPAPSSSTESTPVAQPWALKEALSPAPAAPSSAKALAEVLASAGPDVPNADTLSLEPAHSLDSVTKPREPLTIKIPQTPARVDRSPSAVNWTPAASSSTESTPIEQPWALPEIGMPGSPLSSSQALAEAMATTPTAEASVLASAHRSPSAVEWTPAVSSSTESTPIEQPWSLPEVRTPAVPLASAKALAEVMQKTPVSRSVESGTDASVLASAHRSPSAVEWTPAASSSTESTPIEQPWSLPEAKTPSAPPASAKLLADVVAKTPINHAGRSTEASGLVSAHRSPSAVDWTPAASSSTESTPIEQPWSLPEARTPAAPLASAKALTEVMTKTPTSRSIEPATEASALASAQRSPSAVEWTPAASSSTESTPIEQPWALPEVRVSSPTTPTAPASSRTLADLVEAPSSDFVKGMPISAHRSPSAVDWSPEASSSNESTPIEQPWSMPEGKVSTPAAAPSASARALAKAMETSPSSESYIESSEETSEFESPMNSSSIPFLIISSPSPAVSETSSPEIVHPPRGSAQDVETEDEDYESDNETATVASAAVLAAAVTFSATQHSTDSPSKSVPEESASHSDILGSPVVLRSAVMVDPESPIASPDLDHHEASPLKSALKKDDPMSAFRSPSAVHWTPATSSSTESTPIEQPWALPESKAQEPSTPAAPATSARALADMLDQPSKSQVPLSAQRSPSAVNWTPEATSSTESTPIEQPWALPEHKTPKTPVAPAASSRTLADVVKTPLQIDEEASISSASRVLMSAHRSPSAVEWTPQPSSSTESTPIEQPWALSEIKMPGTPAAPTPASRALFEVMKTPEPSELKTAKATSILLSARRSPSAVNWTPEPPSSSESSPIEQPWALPERKLSTPTTPTAPASSRALAEVTDDTVTIATPAPLSAHRSPSAVDWTPQISSSTESTPVAQPWALPESQISAPSTPLLAPAESSRALAEVVVTPRADSVKFVKATPIVLPARSPSAVQWTPAPSSSAESRPIDQPWALPENEMPETPVDAFHSSRALDEMVKTPSVDVVDVDESDSDHEFSISKATRVPMSAHRSPSAIHWTPELSSSTESTPIEQPWSMAEGKTPGTPAAPAPSSRALAEVMGTPITANPRDSHVEIATATAVALSLRAPAEAVSVPLSAFRSPSAVNWSPEPSSSTESTPIAQPWSLPEGKSVPNTPAVAAPSSAALAKALESESPTHRESLVIEPVSHVELAFRSPSAVMWSPAPASSSEASPIEQPWTMKEEVLDFDHDKAPSVPADKIAPLTFANSSTATLTTSPKTTHVEGLLPAASFTLAAAAAVAAAKDEPTSPTESEAFSSAHTSPEAVSKSRFVDIHDSEDAQSDVVIHSPEQGSPAKSVSSSDTFASATQANSPSRVASNASSPIAKDGGLHSPTDSISSHRSGYASSVASESNINDSVSPEPDSFSVGDASQLTAATTETPSKAKIQSPDDSLLSYKGDQLKNVLGSPMESIPLHSTPIEDQEATFESFPDASVTAQSKASEASFNFGNTSPQTSWSLQESSELSTMSRDTSSQSPESFSSDTSINEAGFTFLNPSEEHTSKAVDQVLATPQNSKLENSWSPESTEQVHARADSHTAEGDLLVAGGAPPETPRGPIISRSTTQTSFVTEIEDDTLSSKNPVSSSIENTPMGNGLPPFSTASVERSLEDDWFALPRTGVSALTPEYADSPLAMSPAAPPPRSPDASFLFPLSKSTPVLVAAAAAGVAGVAAATASERLLPSLPTKPTDHLISKSILSAEIDNDKASQASSDNLAASSSSSANSRSRIPSVTLKPIVKEETRNSEDEDNTIFAVCVVGFHHSR